MSMKIWHVWLAAIISIAVLTVVSSAQEEVPVIEIPEQDSAPEPIVETVEVVEEAEVVEDIHTEEQVEVVEEVTKSIDAAPEVARTRPVEVDSEPDRKTGVIKAEKPVEEQSPLPLFEEEHSRDAVRLQPAMASDNVFILAYEYVIKDRLAVGARVTTFTLEDTERDSRDDSYLGSITKLDAEQDNSPRLFINYKLIRYLGVGVTWNELRAATVTHVREEGIPGDMHTDGTIDLQGLLYYVTVRLPNRTRFTPFAEYGVAQYDSNFDHDPGWRSSGNSRLMVVEDTDSNYYAVGLDIQILEGLQVNLYYRKMDVDVDAKYYLNDDEMTGDPREEATFPMGNYAYGLGLKYAF